MEPRSTLEKEDGKEASPGPKILKPRVDKNYQRVMDLEKEVLELYKMIDYWKSEAKSL